MTQYAFKTLLFMVRVYLSIQKSNFIQSHTLQLPHRRSIYDTYNQKDHA